MAANWLKSFLPRLTSRRPRRPAAAVRPQPRLVQLDDRCTPAVLSINATASVVEGDAGTTSVQFTVTSDTPAGLLGIPFTYSTSNGTATGSILPLTGDYTSVPSILDAGGTTIPNGMTTKTISITVVSDTIVEADETFTVTIAAGPGDSVAAGQKTGTATITNDDVTVLTFTSPTVNEATGTMQFKVTSSLEVQGGFKAAYTTAPGAVSPATPVGVDFTAATGKLTFAGTAGEQQSFNVAINNDNIVEPDETILASVTGISNTSAVNPGGFNFTGTGTGTIDSEDKTTITVSSVSQAENLGPMTFTIASSNPVQGGFDVDYATAVGLVNPASGGAGTGDYNDIAGQVTFNQGNANKTFQVVINNDTLVEPDQQFGVKLSNPVNPSIPAADFILGPNGAGTILSEDKTTLTVVNKSQLEGISPLTFTITSSNPVENGFQVTASTAPGSTNPATAGTDYATTSGPVTFAEANGNQTFDVVITADTVVEADETFKLQLSSPTGTGGFNVDPADFVITGAGIGTIINDDSAVFTLAADQPAGVQEGAQTSFTVSLSNPVDVPTSVTVTLANGTADIANDYKFTGLGHGVTTKVIAFAAGQTSQSFTVDTVDDNAVEDNETFTATLTPPINNGGRPTVTISAVPANVTATGIINNNDTTFFTITDSQVLEGTGGTTKMKFTVKLSNPVDVPTSVDLVTTDGTAVGGGVDYNLPGNITTVNFAANQTAVDVFVDISPDNLVEDNETFTATLTNPNGNGRNVPVSPTMGVATGTIFNDDSATVNLSGTSVTESGTLTFTVSLSKPVDTPVTVTFDTLATGTAGVGTDFTPVAGVTVTFNPGDTSKTVDIALVDDRRLEGAETVTAKVSGLVTDRDVTLGTTTAAGTIVDNESAVLSFDTTTSSAPEDNTTTAVGLTLTITATGAGPVGIDRSIDAGVTPTGTATLGSGPPADYALGTPAVPTFAAGTDGAVLNAVVTIQVFEDLSNEGDETVVLTLNPADGTNGAVSVGTGQHTFTIVNDDAVVRTYDATAAGNYELRLNGGSVQLLLGNVLLAQDPLGTAPIVVNDVSGGAVSLTVNMNAGNPIPAGGVTFNGGAGAGDTLLLSGGDFLSLTASYTNATDGGITSTNGSINFAGIEDLQLNVGTVRNLALNLPAGGTPDALLTDQDGTHLRFTGLTFVPTTVTKPTSSDPMNPATLAVNRGNAADVLTLSGLTSTADITAGTAASPFNVIVQSGPVATTRGVVYAGNFVAVNGDLSAAGVTLVATQAVQSDDITAKITAGLLTLGGPGNLGDYTLANSANNFQTLTIPQAGSVRLVDVNDLLIAPAQAIAMDVKAGKSLTVIANATVQAVSSDLKLTAGTDVVVAAQAKVTAGGAVGLTADGGISTAIGSLVRGGGSVTLAAGTGIAVGPGGVVQSAGGDVSLTTTANVITVGVEAGLTAAGSLSVDGADGVTIRTGADLIAGSNVTVTTAGTLAVEAFATVQGGAAAKLTAGAGDVAIASNVTVRAVAGGVTLAAGAGVVVDGGTTVSSGGATDISAGKGVRFAAGTTATAGGLLTLTAGDSVTLNAGATVQSTGGNVVINTANDLFAGGAVLKAAGTIAIAIDTAGGTGGSLDLTGATILATNTTIDGNTGNDTFRVTGYATPVLVNGKAPSNVPVGDTLVFDAQNKGVVSTPTSFATVGGQPVAFVDIESIVIVNIGNSAFTVVGTDADERVTVTNTPAGPLQYRFDGQVPVTIAGIASFEFDGRGGRDTLVADFGQGSPVPPNGLVFDSGDGDDFGLAVVGVAGTTKVATVTPTGGPGRAGTVVVDGGTITYRNLDPVSQVDVSNVATVNLALVLADAGIDINTGTDQTSTAKATPELLVSGNSIPRVGLSNTPNVTLTTAANGGADAIGITRGDNAHGVQNLTITAADDVVTGRGPLAVGGGLVITAATTKLLNGGDLSAGGGLELRNTAAVQIGAARVSGQTVTQSGGAPVVLTGGMATVNALSATGDTAVFTGTVDGPGGLTVNTGGNTVFNQAVGAGTPVGDLLTDAGGTTRVLGGGVRSSGRQAYGDAVGFSKSSTFAATAGSITFFNTVDPDAEGFDLTIGGPNVDVTTAVGIGTTRRTGTLTVSDGNNVTLFGPVNTTVAVVQQAGSGTTAFNGDLTTPAVSVVNAKDVAFNGLLSTANLTQANGSGTTAFNGGAIIRNGNTAGTFSVSTNSIAFNSSVSVADGRAVLGLRGGNASQAAAGTLTAAMLDLSGNGNFVLDNAGNRLTAVTDILTKPQNTSEVVANLTSGSVNVTDSTDLLIGFPAAGQTAITIPGGTVTLTTPANFRAVDSSLVGKTVADEAAVAKLIDVGPTGTVQINPGVGRTGTQDITKVQFVAEVVADTVTIGTATAGPLSNTGKDQFEVRPMTGARLVVNGNVPTTADAGLDPFDTLKPSFTGIVGISLDVGPGPNDGTYRFNGPTKFQDLVFTSIETLGGLSLEAFVVQTAPRAGVAKTEYAVRLAVAQAFKGGSVTLNGNITGSGIVTNPFVVTPNQGSTATSFTAPKVTAAFVDSDAIPDLVLANGAGDAPIVTIIRGSSIVNRGTVDLAALQPGDVIAQFFAFEESFRGGLSVAAGDFDKDGRPELAVAAGVGGGPRITVFKIDATSADPFTNVTVLGADKGTPYNFFPYEPSFRGGVNVAVGDVNGDGAADLIAGSGQGGGPRVRVYDGTQPPTATSTIRDFFAYDSSLRGGVLVAAGRYNSDDAFADLLTAPASQGGPHVKVFAGAATPDQLFTTTLESFFAFSPTDTTGVISIISTQNSLIAGVSGVAFGASTDGTGGNRSILVSRPAGEGFEVVQFVRDQATGAFVRTPNYQTLLNRDITRTPQANLNLGNGQMIPFDALRQGGSVGAGTAESGGESSDL